MRFLHTGDIHLDSAFCMSGATLADGARAHQRKIFEKIFSLAKQENCDMILICGDLFDTEFVSPATQSLCLSLFEDFGKPVIITPGNHDPYLDGGFFSSAKFSDNVYVFSSQELQFYDFEELDTTVAGFAFMSSAHVSNPLDQQVVPREKWKGNFILCAHTELNNPTSRYAPILEADIERWGFDYAALAHVHNPGDFGNSIRYCSFPEGRSFDELGEGGVYIVDIEPGEEPVVTRHIVSEKKYERVQLSLDGCHTPEAISGLILDTVAQMRQDMPVNIRIDLEGTTEADIIPDLLAVEKQLSVDGQVLEIYNSVLELPGGDFLEHDTTLRGEFYRTLRPQLLSEDTAKRRIALRALKIGLAAIDSKSFTDGGSV